MGKIEDAVKVHRSGYAERPLAQAKLAGKEVGNRAAFVIKGEPRPYQIDYSTTKTSGRLERGRPIVTSNDGFLTALVTRILE